MRSQFVLGAIVLTALALTAYRYHRRQMKVLDMLFWASLWMVALVAIAFPDMTVFVARLFGIGRGVDAAIYLSIVLVFYLIFRLFMRLGQLDNQITAIVRHLALTEREPRAR
jgi:small membrane protein